MCLVLLLRAGWDFRSPAFKKYVAGADAGLSDQLPPWHWRFAPKTAEQ